MIKIKTHNYNVVVEFGNGKSESFKAQRLSGIFANAKALATAKGTTFIQAKIFPLSQIGKSVTWKDGLIIDVLGKYHYYDKGEKATLAR